MSGPILPGLGADGRPATLGVLGGGQLGRMFVHAAQALGYETVVLDPDRASPAGRVSHRFIQADYRDANALRELAARAHAITTEFENVPAEALAELARQDLPDDVAAACMDHALRAHRALGCRGLSRSDFRWDDTRGLAGLYILETNTQPGMTPTSLAPEQAAVGGMSFVDLCRWIVEDASCGR